MYIIFTPLLNNKMCKIHYYKTELSVSALNGAQTAINILPFLLPNKNVCILEPTYNEYRRVFSCFSKEIKSVKKLKELKNALMNGEQHSN